VINANGLLEKVVLDNSGANYAGLEAINILLLLAGWLSFIEIIQVKYLNNIIEQDHRFIKKITKPIMGFKAFHSAKANLGGIETAHMIRKSQLTEESIPAYKQFMALAGLFCLQDRRCLHPFKFIDGTLIRIISNE
jgi:putative transposase